MSFSKDITGKCYNISSFKNNGVYVDLNKSYTLLTPQNINDTFILQWATSGPTGLEAINKICSFVEKNGEYPKWSVINKDDKYDSVVSSVIDSFKSRARIGLKKYGTNLDRKDLNIGEWLEHLQEELMDATLYIQKLKTLV